MANQKTQTSIRFNTSTLNKLDSEAERLGITRTHLLDRIIHKHFSTDMNEARNFLTANFNRLVVSVERLQCRVDILEGKGKRA